MKKVITLICSMILCLTSTCPAVATTLSSVSFDDAEYVESVEDAGQILRKQMTLHMPNIIVKYHVTGTTLPDVDTLANEIFDNACKHTGIPNEGDALALAWKNWDYRANYQYTGADYYLDLRYDIDFYTTTEQEAQLSSAVTNLKKQLQLEDCTDYEKIKGIYEYICNNVTYDYKNKNNTSYDLKYTDYAALIKKTSVCQGYALLFYRLALEYEIDARVILGKTADEDHGWNIVKLDNQYYYIDATWGSTDSMDKYFLKGSDTFLKDHVFDTFFQSEAFKSVYPVSKTDYNDITHKHKMNAITVVPATCTEEGRIHFFCENCGYTYIETIEKLSHVPGKAHTCITPQLCITCNAELVSAKGHRYDESYICLDCGVENDALKPVIKPNHDFSPPPSTEPSEKLPQEPVTIGEVKLSHSIYHYNGKVKSPKVIIKDSLGNVLKKGKDYTVKVPSGRRNAGKYTYIVTFSGIYTGVKTLSFVIKPPKPTLYAANASKKHITISWRKVTKNQATGYQVMMATDKKFKYNKKKIFINGYAKTSCKLANLKSQKTYYIKVRTYKKVKGEKIYSGWSKVRQLKTK